MDYQETLDLLIPAIIKGRTKATSSIIDLDFTNDKKLKILKRKDILETLHTFQLIEKVIALDDKRNYLKTHIITHHYPPARIPTVKREPPLDKTQPIRLSILDGFDNWYSAYLARKNRKLDDLSLENLKKILWIVSEINKKFEMTNIPEIEIYINMDFEDCLKFLCDKSIILNYTQRYMNTGILHRISLTLNVNKFISFYKQFHKFYQRKIQNQPKNDTKTALPDTKENPINNEILYQITFSMNCEIILNDLVILSKPNLNSENNDVFSYLIEHPNKTIKKKDIETHIGRSIGKDFHKIVENLGFAGDLRKTFFKVSNNAILFRNPITKAVFDQLSIQPLKLQK